MVASEKKSALIIANWDYQDGLLRQLVSPPHDASALAEVLADPEIGGFDVLQLTNEPSYRVCEETEGFFSDRARDDVLLLYFSGHGITDDDGLLYYATTNTRKNRMRATSIAAAWVNQIMNESGSRRQVLLLDCCHSGAFARTKALETVNTVQQFGTREEGRGRFALTACDAVQYSFEGDAVQGEGVCSVFTQAIVEGLRTGVADMNGDGLITLDELYTYVHKRVKEQNPRQSPRKWESDVEGGLVIAKNPRPPEVALPDDLQHAVESLFSSVRESAIPRLERLLKGAHRGLAVAAEKQLRALVEDDSRKVSNAAERALTEETRQTEAKRLAEQRAEETRQAEERRLAEPRAEETRQAEERRLAEQRAEETRRAEAKRLAEPRAEETRQTEAKRLAEQRAEETRQAEAKRLAEQRAEETQQKEVRERPEPRRSDTPISPIPPPVVPTKPKMLYGTLVILGIAAILAIIVVSRRDNSSSANQSAHVSSSSDDPSSTNNLGLNYLNGTGVPKDYAQAKQLFEKAAAAGNADAMDNLGRLYDNGNGVPQDYAQAKQWYEKGVAAGSPWAMSDLGLFYSNGNGVPRDYAQAKQWYEKAAAAGNAVAMNNLGVLYENGNGVPKDYAQAKQWYEKAAAAGNADAKRRLAQLRRAK